MFQKVFGRGVEPCFKKFCDRRLVGSSFQPLSSDIENYAPSKKFLNEGSSHVSKSFGTGGRAMFQKVFERGVEPCFKKFLDEGSSHMFQ
jgi:hypothetical protein